MREPFRELWKKQLLPQNNWAMREIVLNTLASRNAVPAFLLFSSMFIRCAATENAIDRNEIIAKTIGQKLEELQRKFVDEAEKVCCFVDFMADQLTTDICCKTISSYICTYFRSYFSPKTTKRMNSHRLSRKSPRSTNIKNRLERFVNVAKHVSQKKLKPKQKACIMLWDQLPLGCAADFVVWACSDGKLTCIALCDLPNFFVDSTTFEHMNGF